MKKDVRFLMCETCKKIVVEVKDSVVPVMCCGKKMVELVPNTTEASVEKHFPVIEVEGNSVKVSISTVEHPMLDVHWIEWICLQTEQGVQFKYLDPGEKPVAVFALAEGDKVVAAYEYCNLHGLWKTEA